MEEIANAKTAKNRAKRQKKKERSKTKGGHKEEGESNSTETANKSSDAPLKKRRLVNGEELVFKRPTDGSEEDSDEDEQRHRPSYSAEEHNPSTVATGYPGENTPNTIETARITILEDD